MQFTKKGEVYRVSRVTGRQNNILGVSFAQDDSNNIELIEWPESPLKQYKDSPVRTSAEEILEQVLLGLESKNKAFNTNYRLSQIYYIPAENPQDRVYKFLISKLINRYHFGGEFKEIPDD